MGGQADGDHFACLDTWAAWATPLQCLLIGETSTANQCHRCSVIAPVIENRIIWRFADDAPPKLGSVTNLMYPQNTFANRRRNCSSPSVW